MTASCLFSFKYKWNSYAIFTSTFTLKSWIQGTEEPNNTASKMWQPRDSRCCEFRGEINQLLFLSKTTRKERKGLLTLYDELYQSFSGFDVKPVVLAGLAPVGSRHLPGHVDDPQDPIVALGLHRPVRHRHLLVRSGPEDDGLGLPGHLALQLDRVPFPGHQGRLFLRDSQIGWDFNGEKEMVQQLALERHQVTFLLAQ